MVAVRSAFPPLVPPDLLLTGPMIHMEVVIVLLLAAVVVPQTYRLVRGPDELTNSLGRHTPHPQIKGVTSEVF